MEERIIDELVKIVGEEYASTDPTDLVCYSLDSYAIDKGILPDIVLRPGTVEEVQKIMKVADKYSIPVVPRGSGTSLTGGVVPIKKGIVMVLTRMDKVIDFNREDMTVTVEPDMINDELNKFLKPHGLFFAPGPASGEICTIGGMVACNASGMHAVKYGTTGDYVLGLKVVLPDGRLLNTGTRTMKTASGYDLVHLFNRSEGTLGVIVEVTLKLEPLPKEVTAAIATFPSMEAAGHTVSKSITSGIDFSAIELLDSIAIKLMRENMNVDLPDVNTILFLEFHGDSQEDNLKELSKFEKFAKEEGCLGVDAATDEEKMKNLWLARNELYAALVKLKPAPVITDIVVPLSRISDALAGIQRIAKEYDLEIANYGHVGDGNIHSVIMSDFRVKGEHERAHDAHMDINRMSLALGGSLTAEHGIGLERKDLLAEQHGEIGVEIMRKIKKALDPKGIMNPGKVFEVN